MRGWERLGGKEARNQARNGVRGRKGSGFGVGGGWVAPLGQQDDQLASSWGLLSV